MQMGEGTAVHQQVNLDEDKVSIDKASAFVPLVSPLANPIPSAN